jgi:hypothetical protein
MKFVLSLAAVLALAVGLNLSAVDPASAWCGWRCRTAVVVAPPVFVVPGPVVIAVPTPNPIPYRAPCGGGCGGAYAYSPVVYGFYDGAAACYPGSACYFRRDCWYDAFGRRFCN